jgi:putative oxidoreductase
MQNYQTAIARVLLSLVFLGTVILRLMVITSQPNGYMDYQVSLGQVGLPGIFAPLLILVQLVAGVGLLVGFKTRFFAYVLAILAIFLAIVLGRFDFQSMFIYLGIAGGMLMLATYPQTGLSMDSRARKDHIF